MENRNNGPGMLIFLSQHECCADLAPDAPVLRQIRATVFPGKKVSSASPCLQRSGW